LFLLEQQMFLFKAAQQKPRQLSSRKPPGAISSKETYVFWVKCY